MDKKFDALEISKCATEIEAAEAELALATKAEQEAGDHRRTAENRLNRARVAFTKACGGGVDRPTLDLTWPTPKQYPVERV